MNYTVQEEEKSVLVQPVPLITRNAIKYFNQWRENYTSIMCEAEEGFWGGCHSSVWLAEGSIKRWMDGEEFGFVKPPFSCLRKLLYFFKMLKKIEINILVLIHHWL